jgi:hypothetical protein
MYTSLRFLNKHTFPAEGCHLTVGKGVYQEKGIAVFSLKPPALAYRRPCQQNLTALP